MIYDYYTLLLKILNEGQVVKPHGEEIKELMHVQFAIQPNCNIYSWPEVRSVDHLLAYAYKEMAWYLSGDRTSDYIKGEAKLWSKITNLDGTLNSNYGYLVFYHRTLHPSLKGTTYTPYEWAFNSLVNDKDTRQAVMTYNNGGYNFDNNHDYICTQHQAFFIRDNFLKCFIALRSSDSIWGLPYNMIWWSFVQQELYLDLLPVYPDLKLGNIEVDIYSSHIYSRHYDLVKKMLSNRHERHFLELQKIMPIGKQLEWYLRKEQSYFKVKDI